MEQKRFDIQFLRGVAVLAVVLFHAFKDTFERGFLGVDVFFVVSGFLITGMILRDLEKGRFSFRHFYARRARRLLPASFSTLAVTTIFAALLLTPAEFDGYAKQLFGALTFTANFFLAQQTGYFAGEAETKILLHIWSLSLEEQFYFIAPVLLWLTPLRARPKLLLGATIMSAMGCFVLVSGLSIGGLPFKTAAKAAFFLLPFRAWELLIGSLAAWLMLRRPGLQVPALAKYTALVLIVGTCIVGSRAPHPGPEALVVTLAAALVLLGARDWLHVNALTRGIAKVGDWSYSIYLVHWPLFAFAFMVYLGAPPAWLMTALLASSVLLGFLQYQYVEQRFLRHGISAVRRLWLPLGAGATALCAGAVAIASSAITMPEMAPQLGLDQVCDQRGGTYVPTSACRIGNSPRVMVWGDSFAMHLVPGLRNAIGGDLGFVQATKAACSPVIGLAQVSQQRSLAWAKDCADFNESVLQALARMHSVRDVVLASSWFQLFAHGQQTLYSDGQEQAWSAQLARERLVRTIRAVQFSGRRVVIVGPTAVAPYDVGTCNVRALSRRFVVRSGGCDPLRVEVDEKIAPVVRELQAVAAETGAVLLLPSTVMCQGDRCQSVADGRSIYRDNGHLTPHGSGHVLHALGFRQAIESTPSSEFRQ
jgi:peptidoglycan/LPS O-acetylase OafA/YrhL